MPRYTNAEACEMLIIYGECHRNARTAAREFRRRFPDGGRPTHATILRLVRRVRETGNTRDRARVGRPVGRGNRVDDADVLAFFLANPNTSTRDAAAQCGVSHQRVWAILHKHKYHPYHVHFQQGLYEGDNQRRLDYCNDILIRLQDDPHFHAKVLWSDEASFTRDGVVNRHNAHYWATENPRWARDTHHQVRWSTNVWCGIYGNRIVGPWLYQGTLNGRRYLELLRTSLADFLDDLPLREASEMWFQHDGATPHRTLAVREWVGDTFEGRCIGYEGAVAWPARSPDLTPLDFFLWGYLKQVVYATPPETLQVLQDRIVLACQGIDAQMLAATRDNIVTRLQACIVADGGHIEHALT